MSKFEVGQALFDALSDWNKNKTRVTDILLNATDEDLKHAINSNTLAYSRRFIEYLAKIDDINIIDTIIHFIPDKRANLFLAAYESNNQVIIDEYSKLLPMNSNYYISRTFDTLNMFEIKQWCLKFLPTTGLSNCNIKIDNIISGDSIAALISNGLLPLLYDYKKYMPYLLAPDEVIYYWTGLEPKYELSKFKIWTMITEAKAVDIDDSFVYLYTYPDHLYRSYRIKTDMSMYRTPFSNIGETGAYGSLNDEIYDYIDVKGKGRLKILDTNSIQRSEKLIFDERSVKSAERMEVCLPVIRYSKSLTAGKYHGEPTQEYCGTFYYYEPESTTYLYTKNILIKETKCQASIHLFNNNPGNTELYDTIRKYLSSYINNWWENSKYKRDLIYTPLEWLNDNGVIDEDQIKRAREVNQFPMYIGGLEQVKLYAAEDLFDQVLCKEARNQGYDLIILTRMVGKYQIVTEVLDARTREESMQSLVYT